MRFDDDVDVDDYHDDDVDVATEFDCWHGDEMVIAQNVEMIDDMKFITVAMNNDDATIPMTI